MENDINTVGVNSQKHHTLHGPAQRYATSHWGKIRPKASGFNAAIHAPQPRFRPTRARVRGSDPSSNCGERGQYGGSEKGPFVFTGFGRFGWKYALSLDFISPSLAIILACRWLWAPVSSPSPSPHVPHVPHARRRMGGLYYFQTSHFC